MTRSVNGHLLRDRNVLKRRGMTDVGHLTLRREVFMMSLSPSVQVQAYRQCRTRHMNGRGLAGVLNLDWEDLQWNVNTSLRQKR